MDRRRKRRTDTNWSKVNQRLERERQAERQRQLAEQEYRNQLSENNKRGALDRVFDVLSTGGYAVNGLIQEGVEGYKEDGVLGAIKGGFEGIVEGGKAGLDGLVPGNKEYGKEYSAKDSLDSISGGAWSDWNGDIQSSGDALNALKNGEIGKFATALGKGAVEFTAEVLTDPTTYLGGAGIAKSLAQGSGKKIGGEVAEKVTKEVIQEVAERKGVELIEKNAMKYAKQANKLLGNTSSVGDVKFAGKALKGSGDFLRNIGDKTIAPYVNTALDKAQDLKVFDLFDTKKPLRDALKRGDIDEYVGYRLMKDKSVADKLAKHSVVNEGLNSIRQFEENTELFTPEMQRKMTDILEDPNAYELVHNLEGTGKEGEKLLRDYIQSATGKRVEDLNDRTAKMVWEEVLRSDKPFERMRTDNPFEQAVIKRMIDPENLSEDYWGAYHQFITNQNIRDKAEPIVRPLKSIAEDLKVNPVRPLDDLDFESGVFINTNNTQHYGKLLRENTVLSRVAGMNKQKKVVFLDKVLFDGKGVLTARGVNEPVKRLNNVIEMIKRGATEDELLRALDGMIDSRATRLTKNIGLDESEIKIFKETGQLPERYSIKEVVEEKVMRTYDVPLEDGTFTTEMFEDVIEHVTTRPDLPTNKPVRIYNKDTREVIYDNIDGEYKFKENPLQTEAKRIQVEKDEMLKRVMNGENISDTDLMSVVKEQKERIAYNHYQEVVEGFDTMFKPIIDNAEQRKSILRTYLKADGHVNLQEVTKAFNANGKKPINTKNYMQYNVKYNKNYSQTVEQSLKSLVYMSGMEEIANDIINEAIEGDFYYELPDTVKKFLYDMTHHVKDDKVNLGGVMDTFEMMMKEAHQYADAKDSDIIRLLDLLEDRMPKDGMGKEYYRKDNIRTLKETLTNIIENETNYTNEIVQFAQQVENLKVYDDLLEGKINSPSVRNAIMNWDSKLPPQLQVNDTYVQTRYTPNGEVIEIVYDPYTRTSQERIAERAVLKDLGQLNAPNVSELDYYLNDQYNNEMLTESIRNYLNTQNVENAGRYVLDKGKLYIDKIDYRLKADDATLATDVKIAINHIFDEFKRMGMSERASEKLNTMLNNYVPHVLNPEILKNPSLLEKIKKKNPELYRQVFASSGDKYNRFGTHRSESLEKTVREILAKGNPEYKGKGKTIAEVNEALKPLLQEFGFDGDFFIHEVFDAYKQRLITHGDVLYSNKSIDDLFMQFGKPADRRFLNPKQTYYINQRTMKNIFSHLDETDQYLLLENMGINFEKVYNKMMIEVKGEDAGRMIQAVEKYADKTNNAVLELYELPKGIAQWAEKEGYSQQLKDTNAFIKVYDKFTTLWKQSATVINPGFHLRNIFSNVFQNYLAVGGEVFNPQTRNTVKRVLNGEKGSLFTKAGVEIPFDKIREQLVAFDIVNSQNFNKASQVIENQTSLFGGELQGDGGIMQFIGDKLGVENAKQFNRFDPTDSANFFAYNMGRKFGGNAEDFDRTLNFIANIKNDLDFEDASEMVDKFLFDYSDLTPFESNVMKRIIPFYTWLRKNVPLQMEMLMEKPWLYAGIADVHRLSNQNANQEHIPGYMSDWIKLPVTFNSSKDYYLNPNLPYQNLENLFTTPQDVIGMLNPVLKMPIEIATNHNNFFDAPIWNETDSFQQALDKIGKYSSNSLMGAWKSWYNALGALEGGDSDKVLSTAGSLVTGIKVGVHDTEKAKQDAMYRAIRQIESQLEQQQGGKKSYKNFNKDFDEYKQDKLEKYGFK